MSDDTIDVVNSADWDIEPPGAENHVPPNDPQGSDPPNPPEPQKPQESPETPNLEQNGSSGTENGTSGSESGSPDSESGSPDSESGPTQRMNGSVSSQIPIPPGNIAVAGPSENQNSNQNNSKIDNFLNITIIMSKKF